MFIVYLLYHCFPLENIFILYFIMISWKNSERLKVNCIKRKMLKMTFFVRKIFHLTVEWMWFVKQPKELSAQCCSYYIITSTLITHSDPQLHWRKVNSMPSAVRYLRRYLLISNVIYFLDGRCNFKVISLFKFIS